FLDEFGLRGRARLLQIDDYTGNAVDEGDALLVTGETRENGERINTERREADRAPLDLIEIDRLTGMDGRPISATRIREQEIDREGFRA
ncbi:MAG: phosphopantetheine adenylyltransferase, partial [Candidatus Nanohaloarchaea archaeon]